MPLYTYSAVKKNGSNVDGEREAKDLPTLARILRNDDLFLLQGQEKGAGGSKEFSLWKRMEKSVSRLTTISLIDKIFFARNLSIMISAGFPLTRAIDAIGKESKNPKIKEMTGSIRNSITQGKTFANSLRPYEHVFGILFIHMVEVGEETGRLVSILKLLARQMKKDYDLKRRVRGAMMYPSIILSALFLIGFFMMIYIVPTLTSTLEDLNVELPATTVFIIGVSNFFVAYTVWILVAVGIFIIAFWRSLKTIRGKALFDFLILRTPIFGVLIKKFNVARFCRILAYLITAGVPIVRSLEITSAVLGNTEFQKAIHEASVQIQKGKQLHIILERYPQLFQPTVIQMIGVGEETGKLSNMMLRLALFFEEDVNETTKNLSTIIEPLLMIIIGVAVGFFAVAMLQPIYSSLGSI